MNRIASSPALPNDRIMVKAGKDSHAPAFGEALAALGWAGGQPGHLVLPTDAGRLSTRRAEPPNGNRAQDADRADPADAGSREGRPARSASGGRNTDPWSEASVPPTPDRDAVGTKPSTPPRGSTDEARTATVPTVPAMPALPGASTAAPAPDMDRTSPTRLPATSQDVTPAAAGLGRRQMAASPSASSPPTATSTARPDARNRIPSDAAADDGDTGSVGPSADLAEPTQAASSPQTTAPPAMSTSPATLPEIPARDLAAPPSSAKIPEAKPDAAPIPRSATAAGAATRIAAPAGQTGTRTPAAAAAAPWPVSDGTDRNETTFRVALAPNGLAAGKVAMAGRTAMTGRPAIQTDTTSVTDDPAAGQVVTPQAAEPSASRPPADFTAGLLAMPPPTSGDRAAAPARTTAVEGTGPATAAAGRTGCDPDTLLQMDAMAAVTPRTADAAVSGPAHVTHPTSQTLPVSVADQVAPMVLSAARNGEAGHRVTVSITPDELGRVNVTVERNSDGTMHIQVSAEHLATLDLLRRDQDELTRTLNQAANSRSGHSLSFSLDHGPAGDGPGSGMGGWSTQGGQQDARPSMPPNAYSDDIAAGPAAPAAARSGIDVTA